MPASALSWCCLLVLLTSAAAAPWNVGDIFATTYGRLHVIDSNTLQVRQTINLFARNGTALCPGKIPGGAFDRSGTILYLACETHSKVLAIDATSTRQHKVLSIGTMQPPSGLTVGRNGTLYISHSNRTRSAISTYSPKADFLGQLWAGNQTITGMKLNAAEDRIVMTSASSRVHQFSINRSIGAKQSPTSMAAGGSSVNSSKCYSLENLQDGSILVACKSCVYHMAHNGTATGNKFCPASNSTALKHIALDPTGSFFYVADVINNQVHKVSLRDWRSVVDFTVPGAQKVQGLVVFRTIDDVVFQKGRKHAEAEWTQAVQKGRRPQQHQQPPKPPAAATPAAHDPALSQPPIVPTQRAPAGTAEVMPSNGTAAQPTPAAVQTSISSPRARSRQ